MESRRHQAVRRWMFDIALPWWATNGVDRANGGFIEQMTFGGVDAGVPFKRTRVAARQVYVFSHAHVLGWSGGVDQTAMGVEHLIANAWQGADKGFARTMTRAGQVLDPVADLYDHAFAMFALAWRFKATADGLARDWLHRTLDFVETHLRHPREGFWNWAPPSGLRQQNPHMHLTEAMLIAHEATGEARFADLARELVALFMTRFLDLKSGSLAEYFTDDLSRSPGDEGRIVEPGHQLEWAWILNRARLQVGVETSAAIRALTGFAESFGVDPASGVTYNQVRDDGAPLDRASRTWPNTERLKAAVALYELDGVDPSPVFEKSCRLLLDRYLATDIPGLWIDAFDHAGRPAAATVPSSTLYHVFLAFAEVLRTGEALGQA